VELKIHPNPICINTGRTLSLLTVEDFLNKISMESVEVGSSLRTDMRSFHAVFYFGKENSQNGNIAEHKLLFTFIDMKRRLTWCIWTGVADLEDMFQRFWLAEALNVVAVLPCRETVRVFTFLPYTESCHLAGPPVMVDQWPKVRRRSFVYLRNLMLIPMF
jgi:hypothetical protein